MSDYGEIFCEAVEEIVRNELRGLDFDLTRICQVDNIDERDKGIYIVSTDSARFKAYSSDITYNIGDTVYVMTPNNDNTQQKIIIAKKVIETPQDITYVMPFNNMTDITKNLVKGSRENSLLANSSVKGSDPLKGAQPIWEYNNMQVGYTRLGVQGAFRSSVTDAIEGSYGLKIELYAKGRNEEPRLLATFFLDADDMYGNPYNFEGYYIQQKVFDISTIPAFDYIKIYFYQEADFKNSQGELISHLDSFGRNLNPNLFVNDLYVCLGYDVNDIYNNGLIIYSEQGNLYDGNGGEKTIKWRLIQTRKDKEIALITEPKQLPQNYHIYLYKYDIDASYNSIAGSNWQEIKNNENKSLTDFTTYTFNTEGIKEFDKFKAIIVYNGRSIYESNILQFTNTADLIYLKVNKLQNSFQIRTSGDYNGIYHVYDNNNNIITAKTTQNLYPMFQDDDGNYISIEGIEKIKWTIPKNNTMINLVVDPKNVMEISEASLPEEKTENAISEYIEKYIQNQIDNENKEYFNYFSYGDYYYVYFLKPLKNAEKISFKLKENYNPNYNNNIIICNLEHANLKLKSTKELIFGYKSVEDYRAELFFENSEINGFLLSDSQNDIKRNVVLKFFDPEGIEIPAENYTVNISWHNSEEDEDEEDKENPLTILFKYEKKENNIYSLSFKDSYEKIENIDEKGYYNVFRADVMYKDYIYTALLPISISTDKEIEVEGATNIIYNNNGEPQNNAQKITVKYKENQKTFLDFVSSYDAKNLPDKYKPNFNSETNQIEPLAVLIENLKAIYCFKVKDEAANLIKIQPIVPIIKKIIKNKSLDIGNANNSRAIIDSKYYKIESANFSAGKLNKDNETQKYTGIVMGKVATGNEEDSKYGLYGFQEDEMTFSINQEGKAYFKGEINAGSGSIGGWTVINDGDHKGSLQGVGDGTEKIIILNPYTNSITLGGLILSPDTITLGAGSEGSVDIGDSIIDLNGRITALEENIGDDQNDTGIKGSLKKLTEFINSGSWIEISYIPDDSPETATIKDAEGKDITVITKLPNPKTIWVFAKNEEQKE